MSFSIEELEEQLTKLYKQKQDIDTEIGQLYWKIHHMRIKQEEELRKRNEDEYITAMNMTPEELELWYKRPSCPLPPDLCASDCRGCQVIRWLEDEEKQ